MIDGQSGKYIGRVTAIIKVEEIIFTKGAEFKNPCFECQVSFYQFGIFAKTISTADDCISKPCTDHELLGQFVVGTNTNCSIGYFFWKNLFSQVAIIRC